MTEVARCPDSDALARFIEALLVGRASEREDRDWMLLHLDLCAECREVILESLRWLSYHSVHH